MNDTLAAVAFRLVHVREGVTWLLISARPTFTPLRSRPIASSLPPLIPAKAWAPPAPIVRTSASTVVSSASVTVSLLFWIAKPPLTWKKPNASIVRVPLACSRLPLAPSMSSAMPDDGPVVTDRLVLPAE
ncbi:hypothetical protein GCM10023144_22970 [Pigmentiphaga soli]|uniref:Uncharacterized protein n=1 Tax=Pigmentiphaga soli TaxID=1007095 RepID=A0ABP8H0R6_9BURK